MSLLPAALLAAAAVLAAPPGRTSTATGRLDGLSRRVVDPAPDDPPPGTASMRAALATVPVSRAAAALAGVAVAVLVPFPLGLLAGVVLGVWADRWLARLEPRAVRQRRERIAADLPVAADLLAACLLAGSPPVEGAEAVAAAVGGPVGEELRAVAATIRLGGDPARCWLELAREPDLAPLGRGLARAMDSGAQLAATVVRLADDQRAERRASADAAARRVGVLATGPLGLCFLPAFLLVGILPVLISAASMVLA